MPPPVTLGAAITVMVTMFAMLAILRFHARNVKGRSRSMTSSARQGTEFYQRLIALELMRVVEDIETKEREERKKLGILAIDLTSETETAYRSSEQPSHDSA